VDGGKSRCVRASIDQTGFGFHDTPFFSYIQFPRFTRRITVTTSLHLYHYASHLQSLSLSLFFLPVSSWFPLGFLFLFLASLSDLGSWSRETRLVSTETAVVINRVTEVQPLLRIFFALSLVDVQHLRLDLGTATCGSRETLQWSLGWSQVVASFSAIHPLSSNKEETPSSRSRSKAVPSLARLPKVCLIASIYSERRSLIQICLHWQFRPEDSKTPFLLPPSTHNIRITSSETAT